MPGVPDVSQYDSKPGSTEINNLAAIAIQRHISTEGDLVLFDYGCGTGLTSLSVMAAMGEKRQMVKRIIGLDPDQKMLDQVSENAIPMTRSSAYSKTVTPV